MINTIFLNSKRLWSNFLVLEGCLTELSYKWESSSIHCEVYFKIMSCKKLCEVLLLGTGETHFILGLGRVNDFLFWHTREPQTCKPAVHGLCGAASQRVCWDLLLQKITQKEASFSGSWQPPVTIAHASDLVVKARRYCINLPFTCGYLRYGKPLNVQVCK